MAPPMVDPLDKLPSEWHLERSSSKNMPYYHNRKTNQRYWSEDDLPLGWAHNFDKFRKKYYFNICDKTNTITYEKPIARTQQQQQQSAFAANSPEPPPPVPEPSYSTSPPAPLDFQQTSPRVQIQVPSAEPARLVRKKSNSLMDLLSPAPDEGQTEMASSPPSVTGSGSGSALRSPPTDYSFPSVSAQSSSSSFARPVEPMTNAPSVTGVKRKFDQISKEFDPHAAASFYNNLQRNTQKDRGESLLFHMRALNNWVKSILINTYSHEQDVVMDLACGKGGDLMKWAKRGIAKYVGVDIARKSLEDAVERYQSNTSRFRDLDVTFIEGDLGRISLSTDPLACWNLNQGWHEDVPFENVQASPFSIVSMQFSLHYLFGDEQRASRFFRTVSEVLKEGGTFIATTVDPNKILKKYYEQLTHEKSQQTKQVDFEVTDEKKRQVCTVQFDESVKQNQLLFGYNAPSNGSFGLRYMFTLRDNDEAQGGEAVDLPEYLVPDDLLLRLFQENGFEILLKENFHTFILKNMNQNRGLLAKMHVLNVDGTLSDAEWEVAGFYQVIAARRMY